MKLRSRFTALFAVLATATIVVLVLVSDVIVGRAAAERVAERFGRELEHLTNDMEHGGAPPESRDAFLRAAAQQLDCRVTYIDPNGKVLDDSDLLPADVPAMENHSNRPEVAQAVKSGVGSAHRRSPTEFSPNRARLP